MGNGLSMIPSGLVVVGQHDDIGAGELIGVGVPPLAGAAGVAGCDDAKARQALNVALALHDEHAPFQWESFHQVGQPVENASDALEIPDPAALAVGLPLAECFWGEPNNLEQQRSEFVSVVGGRDDPMPPVGAAVIAADAVCITILAQPLPGLGNVFALEQIEHAAAFVGLEIKPSTFFKID